MSFPTDSLDVLVEFAFGADPAADPGTWVFVDCTDDWQPDRDLSAKIGRADATSKAQTASLTLWMKNGDGAYTKGNPLGRHWPYIRKNTPVRVTLDPGTGHQRQYLMYATKFLPKFGSSSGQPLVQVTANGIRRRLAQNNTPLHSPLYRATAALTPLAHWALEDGSDATQAGSALTGGTPLTVAAGQITFAAFTDIPGSDQAPELINGQWAGAVPAGASTTGWAVHMGIRMTSPNPVATTQIITAPITWHTVNGYIWSVEVGTAFDGTNWVPYVQAGRSRDPGDGSDFISTTVFADVIDGTWHSILITCTKLTSTSIQIDLYVDGSANHGTDTSNPHTFSPLGGNVFGTDETLAATMSVNSLSLSQLGFVDTDSVDPDKMHSAVTGYAGETVHDRLVRLGLEQGVPMVVSTAATTTMGAQKSGPFLGLLDDCQDADGGILLDGLSAGFDYIARADAYNLTVALTLDMAQRQLRGPFEPQDDDVGLINSETVNREGGSSATYTDVTGDAGTDAIQVYDDEQTLNLASDSDLPQHASWRVHQGTAGGDRLRFPAAGFDLHVAQNASLIEDWLLAGVRTRVQVANPPAAYGPDPIDLLVEGYTETVRSRKTWQVDATWSPYEPWLVFVLGTSPINTDGSTVHATVAAGSSSVDVDVVGPLWVTGAVTLDMEIDGIKVRVTNISGSSSPQTFTITAGDVVKSLVAGRRVQLWQPAALAL